MPNKPILDVLDERAKKREAATQGEWQFQNGNSWRRFGVHGDGDLIMPDTYSRTDSHPTLNMRDEDGQHIVTEHNTGEQVDAALRKAIEMLKASRCHIFKWENEQPTAHLIHDPVCPVCALLRSLGVKLED